MKKQRKGTGVIRMKTQQQTKDYFKTLNKIFKLRNGIISSGEQVSLAQRFSCSWNTMKIAIGLGYIERMQRGKYRKFKTLTDEQIINVIRTKNKINSGTLKLRDVQVDKSMQLKLPLTTLPTKEPKQPKLRLQPTKYEDLTPYEKDYYIKLRYALQKEFSVNLEEIDGCIVLVVRFYKALMSISDAVIHIGAKNGLHKIKKTENKLPKTNIHIDTIVFIEQNKLSFNLGNAIEHIIYGDLEKAEWYLNREINNLKK